MLLVALAVVGLACADKEGNTNNTPADSPDVAAVQVTMNGLRAALAEGDVAGVADLWTDAGLQQVFHETRDSFTSNTGYYVEAKQYSLGVSSEPTVASDTASTVAPLFFRLVGVVRRFSLTKVDGVWKIDGATLSVTDPGGAVPIEVTFGDYTVDADIAAIVDGNIALQISNPTSKIHELNILTAPSDHDLTSFFEHPELEPPLPEGRSMPEGFDFIGGVSAIEPGATVTVVFSQVLPPARYAMFCNAEDDSTADAHSKRGEFVEFTIG